MKNVNKIELVRELEPGGALYSIIDEKNGNFLLGLGLWDRVNSPHTLEVKNRTKGQVVRVDRDDAILARSPDLSNIIYQLMPIDDERIFVGCRSGELLYLNNDLSIQRTIDFKSTGLYFWVRDRNKIVATMREGAVLFLNLETENAEVLQVVSPSVRMWSIIGDEERYIAGSYKGDVALIENKQLTKLIKVSENPSSIWTIDNFDNKYYVGTARGELFAFDKNLESKVLVYRNQTSICCTAQLNKDQIAIGDLKGGIHIVGMDGCVIHHNNPLIETPANTVWWITLDHEDCLLRAAYSNGQMKTFRLS